ncbi:MAG: Uma2 family endonuclease [Candidatus Competibacterales bacterium]
MNPLNYFDPDDPYPESDGQPMAENTEQYQWIVTIKENLEILFAQRDDVFIAGDLLWYPVPDRQISGPMAPDVMVVMGRPKGHRGSYRQWEEDNLPPQVVFEILSPANSYLEMENKRAFYQRYGVEEYYVYNPMANQLEVWQRQGEQLRPRSHVNGWISPRLGIRFALDAEQLTLYHPTGQPFLTSVELAEQAVQATSQAEAAQRQAEAAQRQLEAARSQAEVAQLRNERLAAKLRALGIDPDALEE